MSLSILYEDNHLLIVNKGAGSIVQGARPGDESLLEAAKEYLKEKYRKPGNVYLGVVSRLDRLVTGVLPFARTSKAAARLSSQIRERTIEKIYWAFVRGKLPAESARLEHWLVRDERTFRTFAYSTPRDGALHSVLSYRCLSSSNDLHHLQIELETGRKHQIRAQFAAIACPVLGDHKYGSNELWDHERSIALHCRSLIFQHPTQDRTLRIDAPPPTAWGRSLAES